MRPKFYIFSVNDRNTTANYFVRALKKMKFNVVYLTKNFDARKLKVNDIFFFIDPFETFHILHKVLEIFSFKVEDFF